MTDSNTMPSSASAFAGFADAQCARLARDGIAKEVLIDDFVPGYPATLIDPDQVEGQALAQADVAALVRGLACGAGTSGFGPDVADAAVALFASKRHGKGAMVALRQLGQTAKGVEGDAARRFAEQMESYLGAAKDGNG